MYYIEMEEFVIKVREWRWVWQEDLSSRAWKREER